MVLQLRCGTFRDGDESFVAVVVAQAERLPPGEQPADAQRKIVSIDVTDEVHRHGHPGLPDVERRQEMELARVVDDDVEVAPMSEVKPD